MRQTVAEILGKTGNPQAFQALQRALGDESKYVRAAVAEALWKIGGPQAVPTILQALKDEDEYVREEIAEVLGKSGDLPAVSALLQALELEEDYNVRSSIVVACGKIGDRQAIPALLRSLEDENIIVRQSAVEALNKISDQVDDISALKDIAKGLYREKEWNKLETLANHLDAKQVAQYSLPDPLVVPPIPTWRRSLTRFGRGVAWAVTIVVLGWVLLFSAVLSDSFKVQWKTTVQAWAGSHPGALLGLVTIVMLIGGLLTLGGDALQISLKKN